MLNIRRFIPTTIVGMTLVVSTSWSGDLPWKGAGIAGDGGTSLYRAALRGDAEALSVSCGIASDSRSPPSLRKESLAICRSGIERLAVDQMGVKPHLVSLINTAKTTLKDARSTDQGLKRKPPVVSAECSNNRNRENATDKHLSRCCSEKLRSDDVDGAIAVCGRAIEINPRNRNAYSDRGMAWARKGNLKNAISDLNRAVDIGPNFTISYISRAFIKAQAGDHNGAIADINRTYPFSCVRGISC